MTTISNDSGAAVSSIDLSTAAIRNRLRQTVFDSLKDSENVLINAPTSSGKSHLFATASWSSHPDVTGGKAVVMIHPTRETRDAAAAKSEAAGVRYHVLRGREELCPVAAGEYDDELLSPDGNPPSKWFHEMCESRGINFTEAHRHFHRYDPLPCMEAGDCNALGRYEEVTEKQADDSRDGNEGECREIEFDVIHTTAKHAYVSYLVTGRNVIFDERPDYRLDFKQDHIREAATHYLQKADPRLSWEGMMTAVQHGDTKTLKSYHVALGELPHPKPFDGSPYFNHLPEILNAILRARYIANGRLAGRSGRLTVVFNRKNKILMIVVPPTLSKARCVIGLDGHPCLELWNANLNLELRPKQLLTVAESRSWRIQERGLTVIRLGSKQYARPLTKGWRGETPEARKNQERQGGLIVEQVHAEHPGFQTCVTAKDVKSDVEQMMRDAGIEDPRVMHYGEEKSRNDFGNETTGLILGCIDPGDDMILDWLAALGLKAVPERYETGARAYGRGFIGPDTDAAARLLASVREDHIAQSVGRYARSPGSDSQGAIVYVWSGAIPEELLDGVAPGVIRNPAREAKATAEKRYIIEEMLLASDVPLTAAEIEEVSRTERPYTLKVLQKLVDYGVATKSEGTGPHGANQYLRIEGSQPPAVDLRWTPI